MPIEPSEEEPPSTFNPYIADSVIIDTSLLNNYPCVSKIIDSLTGYVNVNATAQLALYTVFGVNKKLHLSFTTESSWGQHDIDGDTKPNSTTESGVDFSATIRLNPWVLANSTQEYIAATIIHESVHAYVDYKYRQYTLGIIDSTEFQTLFPLFWPPKSIYQANNIYYYNLGNTTQHQVMAANLINILTSPLKSLFPNPNISSILRDSIYHALTWGGLQETTVYRTKNDTLSIIAINTMSRDTSIHSPFILTGYPGTTYNYDSHNTNMKIGCQ